MAFQLAGALLLLLGSFSKTKEYVIDSYYPTDAISRPDDANMCQMRKEKVQIIIRNLYLNRCAFGDLCIGYLLAVFAEKVYCDSVTLFGVIGATVLITWGEWWISSILAGRNAQEPMEVSSEELERRGVPSIATHKEVEEMLEEVFGN